MDNKLFEDDMKEMKTGCVVAVVLSTLVLLAYILFILSPEFVRIEGLELQVIIVFGIAAGLLFLFSLYSIMFALLYKVEVYEDRIYVGSLFGKKTIKLTSEVQFTCKKLNASYSLFKIVVGDEKITVRTKKIAELTRILQSRTTEIL